MNAVIMAGGFGTRLRPLTVNLPKPMCPVANEPMLAHMVKLLARHGYRDATGILYFQPESITDYFGRGEPFGVRLSYHSTESDLGTAGAVRSASHLYKPGPILVTSGDVFTDIDLKKVAAFHSAHRAQATMVLTRVANPLAYGVVITDRGGRIVRFLEKPSWGQVFSDTVNTGMYLLEPEVLDDIPAGQEFDFGKHLFPRLLAKGARLFGYVAPGYWRDVGSLPEYRQVHTDVLAGRASIELPGRPRPGGQGSRGGRVWVGEGTVVEQGASFEGAVLLGKHCRIGAGAVLADAVLGDHAVVEHGGEVRDSVLWDHAYVGADARLTGAIVSRNVIVKRGARLEEGVVVAEGCAVGEQARIRRGVRVWPNKEVEDGATVTASLVWGERWTRSLFGRYGVSGLANLELSPEFASRLGAAYGALLGKGATVATSRDLHKASRMVNRSLICGLMSVGTNVHDLRGVPLPVSRFAVGASGERGGVHVRRSPRHPKTLEIAFLDEQGLTLSPAREKSLEQLFAREDFPRADMDETGTLSFPERVAERYAEAYLKAIPFRSSVASHTKLVVDYAHGVTAPVFTAILGRLGVEVISRNADFSGRQSAMEPAERKASLVELGQIVRHVHADAGVALDPEGEKVSLIDDRGRVLSGDEGLAVWVSLVARAARQRGQVRGARGASPAMARIGVPVTASRVVERIAAREGVAIRRTRTAPRDLDEVAREKGILAVVDENGSVILPEFLAAPDGMFAVGKLLELLAAAGRQLSEVADRIPAFHVEHLSVPCEWDKKGTVMRRVMEFAKGRHVELLDGVKLYRGGAWVLLLPDADRPAFHVYAETPGGRGAGALVREFSGHIRAWQR